MFAGRMLRWVDELIRLHTFVLQIDICCVVNAVSSNHDHS